MPFAAALAQDLSGIAGLIITERLPLSNLTRFGIGGPASVYVETASESSFIDALELVKAAGIPFVVIGSGTNLIVSDAGFSGVVLRFTNAEMKAEGCNVEAAAGAPLQELVDFTIGLGLAGLHTMTGIPGSVGAAVYGNAGAYGRSIAQTVAEVRFYDGDRVRRFDNASCEFQYRESVFKRHKNRVIFSVSLKLEPGDQTELREKAADILNIRNRKYPPTMKCAGSIFKNLLLSELPPQVLTMVPEKVVIEGKVPAAYFLEQVGAKGMGNGDIRVADYHANLIYNEGQGTARQLVDTIEELKRRVREHFGFDLEEEVQYVGF